MHVRRITMEADVFTVHTAACYFTGLCLWCKIISLPATAAASGVWLRRGHVHSNIILKTEMSTEMQYPGISSGANILFTELYSRQTIEHFENAKQHKVVCVICMNGVRVTKEQSPHRTSKLHHSRSTSIKCNLGGEHKHTHRHTQRVKAYA